MITESPKEHDFPVYRPQLDAAFDNYRAAPLLIAGSEAKRAVIDQQIRLQHQFTQIALYEVQKYATVGLAVHISERNESRMQKRQGMNASVYNYNRLYETPNFSVLPDVDPEIITKACRAAKYGKATMAQVDLARLSLGMPSAEYGSLTIFGKARQELAGPMWEEAGELLGVDATPHLDQMTNLRVLGFYRHDSESMDPESFGAIHIGMKRSIDLLDDGTEFKNRTEAFINTDPAFGLNRDDFQEILESTIRTEVDTEDGGSKLEHNQGVDMAQNPAFMRVLQWLIEDELKPGTVLSRHETLYRHNEATQALVEARRQAV